jgi:diapolycopene oxygenase
MKTKKRDMEKSVACVIGSGIGGLASALRLVAKGYSVTVLEKSATPGGKVAQFNTTGYRFDMGPSLFTLPYLVDELFELFGKKREDYLRVITLPMTCNYFFSDGLNLKAWSDKARFLDEVGKTGVKREKVEQYLETVWMPLPPCINETFIVLGIRIWCSCSTGMLHTMAVILTERPQHSI